MEKEISSGTMLGIVLIALAAVIGLGFGVFSIAKGVANEGTVGVQDNLNTVTDSAFEDYNDKVVTGTQVKSAIQNFEGKSVAILINTTAMNKGVVSYTGRSAGATVLGYGADGAVKAYVNYNALLAASSDGNKTSARAETVGSDDEIESVSMAVADKATGYMKAADQTKYTRLWATIASEDDDSVTGTAAKMKDGVLTVCNAFAIDDTGKVMTDLSVGGLSKTGNCEYVSPSSKFEANLIKDTSGTNIGIMFTQLQK